MKNWLSKYQLVALTSVFMTVTSARQLTFNSLDTWKEIRFNGIPPTEYTASRAGLQIKTRQSSSALLNIFEHIEVFQGFSVEGHSDGSILLSKADEDFALRIGFLVPGTLDISWLDKLFLPGWVKELKTSNPGFQFKELRLWNFKVKQEPSNSKITSKKSKFVVEKNDQLTWEKTEFSATINFENQMECFGVWIQSDGDDSKSSFDLSLNKVNLITAN